MHAPIDFELPREDETLFRFDAAYRRDRVPLLFFYRGHW